LKKVKEGASDISGRGKRVFVKFFVEKGITGLIRNRFMPRGKKSISLVKALLYLYPHLNL
jgi:hypothetical protein